MTDHLRGTHQIPALEELRDEFVRVGAANSRSGMSPALRSVAVVVAVLSVILAGTTATFIINSDSDRATEPSGPMAGGFEASGPRYASLQELVTATDLVTIGTVREVLLGEVTPDEGSGQYATRDLNVVVTVDEALKGSVPAGVVTVKTLELAFGQQGREEWREPGKRVLLFLSPSRETPGLHILANVNYSQTAYVIQGDELATAVWDPLGNRVAAMSLSELRQAVQEAQ